MDMEGHFNCTFWIAEKLIEYFIPKVFLQGAKVVMNAAFSNDIENDVVRFLGEGNMKLVFHNLTSLAKNKQKDMEFWEKILKFAGSVSEILISAFITAVGNFFTILVGGLVITEIKKMIDVILNMVQGSVAEASYEIYAKADELEKQVEELKEFTVAVKNMLPKQ